MGEQERDHKKDIEAILFAAGRTVTQEEIERILDVKTPGLVKEIISELKAEYDSREGPVFLIEEGDGWKLTIKESFLPVVHSINPHTELSKATMETLAVIAWKQPILQAQVVEIRSNKAYDHVKELVELGFISKEKYGRSYIIKPTQKFLDYFDLPDQEAAKKLFKEFKDEDLQKKMGEFKNGEKQDATDGEHLGDLQVYDAGEESDTYADRHALNEKPKAGDMLGDLEVVDEPEESEEVAEADDKGHEDEEEGESAEPEGQEEPKEGSEDDKAKALAKQLLEEDQPKGEEKSEEELPSRELNPALEDYVKPEGEEQAEEQPEQKEERPQELETPEETAQPEQEEVPSEGEEQPAEESQPEDDDYEKKRQALEQEEIQKEAAPEEKPEES